MDKIDLIILNTLQKDGRTPFTQIAKSVGVAESTIRSRYASLVERGILRTIAMIDPFSIGYNSPALIGISVEPGIINAVAETIKSMPEVSYLVLTMGGFDLMVEVFCRDRVHLTEVITDKIQSIKGVRSTETLVIGKIFKYSYLWQPEMEVSTKQK
ncbi:MAG: AsnC family transcriptional regulator [Anaerolineaceae bacterium]|nr:AsnC family transcriptional regulator [Anaerolineaceae bacterium]